MDVIHAVLLSAAAKREAEIAHAVQSYTQTNRGLNDPVLKLMCHGPDYGVNDDFGDNTSCDIRKDEENFKFKALPFVEHPDCKAFKNRDHWEYKHHNDDHRALCKTNGCPLKSHAFHRIFFIFFVFLRSWISFPANFN